MELVNGAPDVAAVAESVDEHANEVVRESVGVAKREWEIRRSEMAA